MTVVDAPVVAGSCIDQVERSTLALVKGLGGALLREKIVASASADMLVVVDETKL
ncbi:MAG TPA: ribose-5-phosphate isomerase A, partial [Caldilineaceae bacterium]|nr:ribose-5-phosphate isomerase A [Caldilineaceae bacterium]